MSCFFIWSLKNVCVFGNVIQRVIWEVKARVLGSKLTAASTWAGNVPETSLQVWPSSAELSPGEAGAGLGWPLLAHTGSDFRLVCDVLLSVPSPVPGVQMQAEKRAAAGL